MGKVKKADILIGNGTDKKLKIISEPLLYLNEIEPKKEFLLKNVAELSENKPITIYLQSEKDGSITLSLYAGNWEDPWPGAEGGPIA